LNDNFREVKSIEFIEDEVEKDITEREREREVVVEVEVS
jgi:hypothetical protein